MSQEELYECLNVTTFEKLSAFLWWDIILFSSNATQ